MHAELELSFFDKILSFLVLVFFFRACVGFGFWSFHHRVKEGRRKGSEGGGFMHR